MTQPPKGMPWRYPAGWFAVLMSLVFSNSARNGEDMSAFMNPGYALGYIVPIGLVAYFIARYHWRSKQR